MQGRTLVIRRKPCIRSKLPACSLSLTGRPAVSYRSVASIGCARWYTVIVMIWFKGTTARAALMVVVLGLVRAVCWTCLGPKEAIGLVKECLRASGPAVPCSPARGRLARRNCSSDVKFKWTAITVPVRRTPCKVLFHARNGRRRRCRAHGTVKRLVVALIAGGSRMKRCGVLP